MNTILSENYFKDSLKHLHNNEPEECIGTIDIAISLSPQKAFYIYQKIKMLYALKLYDTCISMIVSNIRLLYTYCSLFTFSEVLSYYVSASECSESDLSSILLSNNIPRSLANEYTLILKNPRYDFTGKAFDAKANSEYAICCEYCQLALKQENNDLSLLLLKAECHTALGQPLEAIRTYKIILLLDGEHILSLTNLSQLFMKQSLFEESLFFAEKLTELSPDNIEYLDLKGSNFLYLRKCDEAIKVFEKIIELSPDYKKAYISLSEIYKHLKQSKLSKHYLKLANKLV